MKEENESPCLTCEEKASCELYDWLKDEPEFDYEIPYPQYSKVEQPKIKLEA